MIVGIEENPRLQPAVCSFLGYGSAPGRKFVRLIAPNDVHMDTLLMSDNAFREIAKLFEYVPASTLLKSVEELRVQLDTVDDNVTSLSFAFDSLTRTVAEFSGIDDSVEKLRELFEAIRVRVGIAVDSANSADDPFADLDGESTDSSESGSVEPLD